MAVLQTLETETGPRPVATLIVLHGLGADGSDFVPLAQELDLRSVGPVRFVFPHAPVRPVTINGGYRMRAWYDILGTETQGVQDEAGLRGSREAVGQLLQREKERGMPSHRIVLAGFSQGCAMALLTGLRHPEPLAGIVGLSGYLLLPTLTRQAAQLASDLPDALTQLIERVRELARGYGFQVGGGGGFSASTFSNVAGQVLGGALGLFGGLASLFTAVLILTIVPIYLAAQPEPAVGWFIRFFPPDRRDRVREVLSKVRSGLLLWLKGRIADMAIVGILSTVALYLIGVPGALFLGILTGLLAFVPLVGSIVSAIPPLLLAFVVGPTTVLWVLVAYVAIQQIEGNVVEPLIMQKTASLHPAAVVTVVTVLGAAFGVLGSILAVPSAIVAAILVKELWFRRLEEARSEPNRNAGNEGTPEKPRQTVRDA